MKNQYFGDARDYFKFDVLDELASGLSGVKRLSCIWMLTGPDRSGHGQLNFVPDPALPGLTAFFDEVSRPAKARSPSVKDIARYFAARPFEFISYGDDSEDFGISSRRKYFGDIPNEALRKAVIFLDPDTGMEPKRCTEAHLRYDELATVFERAGEDSVVVVYQHQRRTSGWLQEIGGLIASDCGAEVGFIAEPDLAFFALAATEARRDEAVSILDGVASRTNPLRRQQRIVGII